MSTRKSADPDPLATRVQQVADLVRALRAEVADLRTDVAVLGEELAAARRHVAELESERGTVRQRVQRMLDLISG